MWAESHLHDGVQVLSGRGHGAGVHRRALGHHGDVMVGVLGECRRRDDDRGVVGGRRGCQHLEGGRKKTTKKRMRLKQNKTKPKKLAPLHTTVLSETCLVNTRERLMSTWSQLADVVGGARAVVWGRGGE